MWAAARAVVAVTGLPREKVQVEMTRVGGGFGRRLTADYVAEAAIASKLTGHPIRLVWTREDDLQHDFFRPFGHHHLMAALDDRGRVTAPALTTAIFAACGVRLRNLPIREQLREAVRKA